MGSIYIAQLSSLGSRVFEDVKFKKVQQSNISRPTQQTLNSVEATGGGGGGRGFVTSIMSSTKVWISFSTEISLIEVCIWRENYLNGL